MADWIGVATFAAKHCKEEPHRDSTAEKARRWKLDVGGEGAGRAGKRRKERVVKLLRPPQLGGHELEKVDRGWQCTVCSRASQAWNTLAGRTCRGSAAGMWARRARELGGRGGSDGAGHVRASKGGVVWCVRCGAYAVRWAIGLAEPCREKPSNPSQCRVLARLRAGRHPRSNLALEGALMVEVPGMDMEGIVGRARKIGGSGLTGVRGRNFAGYARRPGGMQLIDEVAGLSVCAQDGQSGGDQADGEACEGRGPRWAYFERRKRMRLRPSDVEEGPEREVRRRMAVEACEEDARITTLMLEKWEKTMVEASAEGMDVEDEGIDRPPGDDQGAEGERVAVGLQVGESISRKQLVGLLKSAVRTRRQSVRQENGEADASSADVAGWRGTPLGEGGGSLGEALQEAEGLVVRPEAGRQALIKRLRARVAAQRAS